MTITDPTDLAEGHDFEDLPTTGLSLVTADDWRAAAAASRAGTDTEKPKVPSYKTYSRLSPEEQDRIDLLRFDWMAEMPTVDTPSITKFTDLLRHRAHQNRRKMLGRTGIAIDGPATTGKTKMLEAAGMILWTEAEDRLAADVDAGKESPLGDGWFHTPVAYVNVPAGATAAQFDRAFLDFYKYPWKPSHDPQTLTSKVRWCVEQAGTEAVFIDEAHLLHPERGRQGPTDHVKNLMNQLPVAIVLAGQELAASNLFKGKRAEQLAGRFKVLRPSVFTYRTKTAQTLWAEAVATFEDHLMLYKHDYGSLRGPLAAYLHGRTQGRLSSLSNLLVDAAREAIETGEERITYDLLEEVTTDWTTQNAWESDAMAKVREECAAQFG